MRRDSNSEWGLGSDRAGRLGRQAARRAAAAITSAPAFSPLFFPSRKGEKCGVGQGRARGRSPRPGPRSSSTRVPPRLTQRATQNTRGHRAAWCNVLCRVATLAGTGMEEWRRTRPLPLQPPGLVPACVRRPRTTRPVHRHRHRRRKLALVSQAYPLTTESQVLEPPCHAVNRKLHVVLSRPRTASQPHPLPKRGGLLEIGVQEGGRGSGNDGRHGPSGPGLQAGRPWLLGFAPPCETSRRTHKVRTSLAPAFLASDRVWGSSERVMAADALHAKARSPCAGHARGCAWAPGSERRTPASTRSGLAARAWPGTGTGRVVVLDQTSSMKHQDG